MWLWRFYRTREDKPVIEDEKTVRRMYERMRWSVFLSILFGYGFFYVCRLSFSVAKKPMLDAGVLNADQMGRIGSALFITYAIGKLCNGFLVDRCHVARFIGTGLLVSSVVIILFGFNESFFVFWLLWGIHGWFQSMGSAPCGAALSQWFSNRERGTRYGIWSTSHSVGEGFSFLITAAIIAHLGWRWGFWVAGGVSMMVALLIFKTLADRPRTYGLPAVADYKNDHAQTVDQAKTVGQAQWQVIRNPYVWILGLSSASMYIARYGISSWGILFLQEAKSYDIETAGFILFVAKMVEMTGSLSSGLVSDMFFKSRRNVVTLIYGIFLITGFIVLYFSPSTHLCNLDRALAEGLKETAVSPEIQHALKQNGLILKGSETITAFARGGHHLWEIKQTEWYRHWSGLRLEDNGVQLTVARKYNLMHIGGLCLFGFGIGGLLVFLGGLIAIDICSKRAAGAAMGLVGCFSYIGSAIQERISGYILETDKIMLNGAASHDFSRVFIFWMGAAIFSVALSCTLWNVKAKD